MSVYDDVKAALLTVARVGRAERQFADHIAETRQGSDQLRAEIQALRERQAGLEARLASLDDLITARTQAMVAAGVGTALAGFAERLARLEAGGGAAKPSAPARLPKPRKSPT